MSHAGWLYFRFLLSHRDVEELLFMRGVIGLLRSDPQVVSAIWAAV
jgi:hypothetical protein